MSSTTNLDRLAHFFIGTGIGISLGNLFIASQTQIKKAQKRYVFDLPKRDREGRIQPSENKHVIIEGEAIPFFSINPILNEETTNVSCLDEKGDTLGRIKDITGEITGELYISNCMLKSKGFDNPVALWKDQLKYIVTYPLLLVGIGVNIFVWGNVFRKRS